MINVFVLLQNSCVVLFQILAVEKENESLKQQVTVLTDRVCTLESVRVDTASQLSNCMG